MKPLSAFICLMFLMSISCKSSKTSATNQEIKALEVLIKNKNFTIESDWAYPQVTTAMQQVLNSGVLQPGSNASAISLIGNSNFLTISGDSITSYLPYFGERQMNVGYGGNDSAIQFKGLLENYEIEKGKNNSYNISFNAKSKLENFKVNLTLFPNLKSDMQLNGSSRFQISYKGRVELLDKK